MIRQPITLHSHVHFTILLCTRHAKFPLPSAIWGSTAIQWTPLLVATGSCTGEGGSGGWAVGGLGAGVAEEAGVGLAVGEGRLGGEDFGEEQSGKEDK